MVGQGEGDKVGNLCREYEGLRSAGPPYVMSLTVLSMSNIANC